MSMFLLHNWHIINNEIAAKLEESKNAIDDLYCVLLTTYLINLEDYYFKEEGRTEEDLINHKKIFSDLQSAANDISSARSGFYNAPIPPTEEDTINIFEGYYNYILENNEVLAEEYVEYLKYFLAKYNIRYRLFPPCKLTLSLEGLLWTQMNYIKHFAEITGSQSRIDCIKMLEHHINKIDSSYEEIYCIEDSIKLIEHFLYERTKENTLGKALDKSGTIFPSNLAKESLEKYYEFTNKHPNVRHIGSYEPPIRDLNKSDALLAFSLAIAYSAFIIQDHDAILYGRYAKISEETENDLFRLFI
ncbi:MAG: hypothetical protein WCP70_03460 [Methanothrix sp.]